MKNFPPNRSLHRILAILGVTALLLGLAKPASVAADDLLKQIKLYLLFPPVDAVCLNTDVPFNIVLQDKDELPLGEFTVRMTQPGGGYAESSGKTQKISVRETLHYQASREGKVRLEFTGTSVLKTRRYTWSGQDETSHTLTVEKCEKGVNINYQGIYKLSTGGGTPLLAAAVPAFENVAYQLNRDLPQEFAWLASETALLDDVVLTADESGKNYTGSGQLWYTLRVWGSGTFVNCSMDPAIEATAQVDIQAQVNEDTLDVSMDFKPMPPLTPAITLSCTLFDGSKVSLGPLPTSGTVDPSQLGLDSFSVPAAGGMKTSTLTQGVGFTGPGQGMAAAIITSLMQSPNAAVTGNGTRSARTSPWFGNAFFRSPAFVPIAYRLDGGR